jgi:CheY-like chemotaxis protein/nitrogen-specific signal transduction histidine kinase
VGRRNARHEKRTGAFNELRRLRRRLRQAGTVAKARADSLAVLSHEIREPINGVLGMARLLDETRLDEEQRRYMGAIIESAEAIATLINDVLDLARVDHGSLELVLTDFALRGFLERVCAAVQPRAEQRGLGLVLETAPDLPSVVRGDPGRLRQVLLNLLGNALKFTEQGEIRVQAGALPRPSGGHELILTVRDTGIGMTPEARARLFAAFAQGTSTTAKLYGGSGLGLVIAQRIVRMMGGDLALETAAGQGTAVTARVVLQQATEEGDEVATGDPSLAGTTLLVIDPEQRTRDGMRDLAQSWGMEVRAARSLREGLSLLEEAADRGAPFDLVVLDGPLRQPEAIEFAHRVRRDLRLAHTRIVLLASSGLRGDAGRAHRAGFNAYLRKPVKAEDFRTCLQLLRGAPGTGGELLTIHSLSERPRRPLSVLVVDDSPINCRLASILLGRAGHEVMAVNDGGSALDALRQRPFDIVLMDVQMPGMDGLEATRRIRELADPARADTPIVAVTASAMRGDDEECRAAGMDGYLAKPIEPGLLLAMVERLAIRQPA